MPFVHSLLAWANVPFMVALGVAVGFALLQMSGLLGLLAGAGDHAGGAAHEGHEAHHEHEGHDGDAHGDHAKAPISIVWQSFAIAFGFAGFAINTVYLGQTGALPTENLLWTIPTAAAFALVVTRLVSRTVGRAIAGPEQEATTRGQLVGRGGVVISSRIDAEFGEVRIKDKTGHVLRIVCRTRERATIPEGSEVVVVDWEPEGDRLYVAPLEQD